MSVYVDAAIHIRKGKRWCHLIADSEEELHTFAARLGIGKSYFSDKKRKPGRAHYDITDAQRRRAVETGAIECNRSQFLKVINAKRDKS